jgi:hypothetical protein
MLLVRTTMQVEQAEGGAHGDQQGRRGVQVVVNRQSQNQTNNSQI